MNVGKKRWNGMDRDRSMEIQRQQREQAARQAAAELQARWVWFTWNGMVGVLEPGDIPFYGQGTYYVSTSDGKIFKKDRDKSELVEIKENKAVLK